MDGCVAQCNHEHGAEEQAEERALADVGLHRLDVRGPHQEEHHGPARGDDETHGRDGSKHEHGQRAGGRAWPMATVFL